MANRPFSTFLLELPQQLWNKCTTTNINNNQLLKDDRSLKSRNSKKLDETDSTSQSQNLLLAYANEEPTPISFEPCCNENVGVVSVFVQLPGKSNLAIGSALVGLIETPGNKDTKSASSQL